MNPQADSSGPKSHRSFSPVDVHFVPGRLEAVTIMGPPQQCRQCLQATSCNRQQTGDEGYGLQQWGGAMMYTGKPPLHLQ